MTHQTHIRPTWTQKFSLFFFRKKCIFGPSNPIQAERPKSVHGPLQWGGLGRFPTSKCLRKRVWVRIMTPRHISDPPGPRNFHRFFFEKVHFWTFQSHTGRTAQVRPRTASMGRSRAVPDLKKCAETPLGASRMKGSFGRCTTLASQHGWGDTSGTSTEGPLLQSVAKRGPLAYSNSNGESCRGTH